MLIIGFISFSGYCQSIQLSSDSEVSIITFGVGQQELYSAFGHNAIRVHDSVNEIDICFNYGAFDFNQPHFYLNYTRGLLNFKLAVNRYSDLRDAYIFENRSIEEQILDLSLPQRQRVFEFLSINALPQNSTYRYDYFFNNCATKVRDVFVELFQDSIRFDSTFIKTNYSFRQIADLYLDQQPWGDLGINIGLGSLIDKQATKYQYMFMPEYVKLFFDFASIKRLDQWTPIVKKSATIYKAFEENPSTKIFQPWTVFASFMFITIVLTLYDWRRRKISKWFDLILFGVLGILGIMLLLLWVATDHWGAGKNFNLLWALPTNLLVFTIFYPRCAFISKIYFSFVGIFMVLIISFWGLGLIPQQMNTSLILVIFSVAIRSVLIVNFIKLNGRFSRLVTS